MGPSGGKAGLKDIGQNVDKTFGDEDFCVGIAEV